jgi:hypothetical protein
MLGIQGPVCIIQFTAALRGWNRGRSPRRGGDFILPAAPVEPGSREWNPLPAVFLPLLSLHSRVESIQDRRQLIGPDFAPGFLCFFLCLLPGVQAPEIIEVFRRRFFPGFGLETCSSELEEFGRMVLSTSTSPSTSTGDPLV